jgi:hypothetical protein
MTGLVVIGEDALSCVLGRQIVQQVAGQAIVQEPISTGGATKLQRNLSRYSQLASRFRVLCIADTDGKCAKQMLATWLPAGTVTNFALRFAVTETESWVMADRERFAGFLGIRTSRVPGEPDDLADPKGALLNLARQVRSRELRADLVSPHNPTKPGSGYNGRLAEFVATQWRVDEAASQSKSLARAVRHVEGWFD